VGEIDERGRIPNPLWATLALDRLVPLGGLAPVAPRSIDGELLGNFAVRIGEAVLLRFNLLKLYLVGGNCC
jgi:hypothetical protein